MRNFSGSIGSDDTPHEWEEVTVKNPSVQAWEKVTPGKKLIVRKEGSRIRWFRVSKSPRRMVEGKAKSVANAKRDSIKGD